jgi:hypothetical protein
VLSKSGKMMVLCILYHTILLYKRTSNDLQNTHDTKDRATICASDNPVNITYSEWQTGYCISEKHIKITKTKTKNVETHVDRCLSFCAFLLAIGLSTRLHCTDSDYLIDIAKLFSKKDGHYNIKNRQKDQPPKTKNVETHTFVQWNKFEMQER